MDAITNPPQDIKSIDLVTINLLSSCVSVDLGSTFTYTLIIENKSELNLYNLNITQSLYKYLNISDIIMDSLNISTYSNDSDSINFFIKELKYREKKVIDIVVELFNIEDDTSICSFAKIEYPPTSYSTSNIIVSSNTVEIDIVRPRIVIKKISSSLETIVSDILTFDLYIQNKGNILIENIFVRDILTPELEFIPNSILINNMPMNDLNIIGGVSIDTLDINMVCHIKFKAKVKKLPQSGVIKPVALAQYQYSLLNDIRRREGNCESNENIITIQKVALEIEKIADKSELSIGDYSLIEIKIINTGTVNLKNIFLKENLDTSLTVVDKSYKIDNIHYNNLDLTYGIFLGDLPIGEYKILTFLVNYFSSSTKDILFCTTNLNYDYQLRAGLIFKGDVVSNTLKLNTALSNFKYLSICEDLWKSCATPNILDVDNVIAEVSNLNFHVIKTIVGTSNDGQILTGYKVVVQQIINITVEYTSDDKNNSVYTFNSTLPFSSFIVLPQNYKIGSKLSVNSKIDHITFKKKTKNCIYLNLCILLSSKIHSFDDFERP